MHGAIAEGGDTCIPHIWGPGDDNPLKMVDGRYSSRRLPYIGRYSAEREREITTYFLVQ